MTVTQGAPVITDTGLDQLAINTIRTLSIDAVQQAKSGHPGTPMALAPLVYTIWNRVLRFDPKDPIWPGRDRFVLSNGHASMLLWSVLHLTKTQAVNAEYENLGGLSVTLEGIKRFRQLDSKAPGHPEYHWTSGVEATTGPLGQGVATSAGMAIAGKFLASRYNKPGFDIFGYRVYAVCGDGCLMGSRRQRRRRHPESAGCFPRDQRPANADRARQPHRIRVPAQTGHRGSPRRALGRRRGPACEAGLRMA
jgi:transketolase